MEADVLIWSAGTKCRPSLRRELTRTMSSTKPLQLINTPMVRLSLHTSLQALAARVPPMIFPENATAMTPITYAHVMPSFSRPRLVLRPDSAKYKGRNRTETRSSIFSASLIAKPPSWGQMSPTRNARISMSVQRLLTPSMLKVLTTKNRVYSDDTSEPSRC